MNEVVELLTALGGREQLVLFLTGPAGAEKNYSSEVITTILFQILQCC